MRWVTLAAMLLLVLGGCGVAGGAKISAPVRVYVSLPLSGPRADAGRDAADGARLALEGAHGRAGDLDVAAIYLDDARGRSWDPVAVGENARRAVQDSSAAAYLGELDSEPTRASVPITNDAGIVQVSPGAGGVDLTQPATGYPDSPERYQPSGSPSFARPVPSDEEQVAGAAGWASELGMNQVGVDSDGSPFQDLAAEEFTTAAEAHGVRIASGGEPRYDIASQSLEPGGLMTSAVLDPSRLPDRSFADRFRDRFRRSPGPYAAFGYESMALILQAIDGAGTDPSSFRDKVRNGLLGSTRDDSVLGPYSIKSDGDSTECRIQRYRGSRPLGAPCPTD